MDWKEKLDFIKSLGWVETGFWANRAFYGYPFGSAGKTFGQLVEHNNDWSISKGDDTYCIENPSNEMIAEYTGLVKRYAEVVTEPERHTVRELMDTKAALKDFFKRSEEEAEMNTQAALRNIFKQYIDEDGE